MAKYVRHFLEDAIGVAPSGVTVTFGSVSAPPVQQSYNPFGTTTRFLGDRLLQMVLGTGGGSKRREGVQLDSVTVDGARADLECRFSLWVQGAGTGTGTGATIGGRVSGSSTSWTGYFADLRFGANTLALVKGSAGADTDLVTTAFTFTIGTGILYSGVFKISGTAISLKLWDESTPEPAAWTLTTTDATISAAGAVMIGHVIAASGLSPDTWLWHFAIATGTDTSPARPKSRQEYQAFLDLQDALHCVLIEIDPLGQDSGGAALTGRVCMANMPFVSFPEDRSPNVCYEEILLEAPKNRRRMNELFRGKSTISYGDVIFVNEVVGENDAGFVGRLDPWFKWNWDGRPIRVLYGHPTWRRCDFRMIMFGLVDKIDRSGYGKSVFKIKGQDGSLMRPLTTATIGGSGPNASALMPSTRGFYFNVDVTSLLYDQATLTYQVCKPGSNDFAAAGNFFVVRDSGGSLNLAARSISSVNTGTDTITADAAHNLVANATVVPTSSGFPAPLALNQKYYVISAGLTATDFRLSLTRGGAAIDLTTSTAGGSFTGRLYDFDDTTGRISLISNPTGRITVDAGSRGTTPLPAASAIAGVAYTDVFHPSALAQIIGDWCQVQRAGGEEIDFIFQSVGAAWQFTREGNLYAVVLDIPGAATLSAITADDIRNWRKGTMILPAEVERLGYAKNFTVQKDGLLSSVTPTNRDLYGKPYSLTGYTPSESGLEQPANHLLRRSPPERETLLMNASEALAESTRLYNLYRKTCGTFLFDTGAWGFTAEIGDVLPITHPRDGFENGKNVVIVGIGSEDPARGTLELEVFCQIDGAWPVVSATQPFASEAYY